MIYIYLPAPFKAFPRMQSKRYSEQLDHIKFQVKLEIALKKEALKMRYAEKKGAAYQAVSKDEIIKRLEEQAKNNSAFSK